MVEALTFWLEMIDDGGPTSREEQFKYGPQKGNAKTFINAYNESVRRYNCEDSRERPLLGDKVENFAEEALLVPAVLLRSESRIYNELEDERDKDYIELYDKILKYVKIFCYTAANEKDGPINITAFKPSWMK